MNTNVPSVIQNLKFCINQLLTRMLSDAPPANQSIVKNCSHLLAHHQTVKEIFLLKDVAVETAACLKMDVHLAFVV